MKEMDEEELIEVVRKFYGLWEVFSRSIKDYDIQFINCGQLFGSKYTNNASSR